jgi:hypothetical protein
MAINPDALGRILEMETARCLGEPLKLAGYSCHPLPPCRAFMDAAFWL